MQHAWFYISHEPQFFWLGLCSIWDFFGLSFKHLGQAFVTGLIIKAGYWVAHQFMKKPRKKTGAMPTLSAIGSVIDDAH